MHKGLMPLPGRERGGRYDQAGGDPKTGAPGRCTGPPPEKSRGKTRVKIEKHESTAEKTMWR